VTPTRERVLWHFTDARTDTALVRAAVWVEQLAALAYATAADRLEGDARRLALRFAEHERAHAAAMESLLESLTETVRNRPIAVDVSYHLPRIRQASPAAALTGLAELEEGLAAGYLDMARRIGDPELMRTPATVLAGGAQHLVALRHALRAQPPER
jgi:Ferritin-like domain